MKNEITEDSLSVIEGELRRTVNSTVKSDVMLKIVSLTRDGLRLGHKEHSGQSCSVCAWTNHGCLNLGDFGKPRWVCHGCIKRGFDQLSTITAELAEAAANIKTLEGLLETANNRAVQLVREVVAAEAKCSRQEVMIKAFSHSADSTGAPRHP